MSAPALVLVVELEGGVRAYVDSLHEGDAERLADWLLHADDEQVRAAAELATDVWERTA